MGQLEAIVCADKDLHEDLISVNPFLDKGFALTMDADQGQLVNNQTGVTIGVLRQGAKWSVDLEDVAAASATINGPREPQPPPTSRPSKGSHLCNP